jgi:hypothetical protein
MKNVHSILAFIFIFLLSPLELRAAPPPANVAKTVSFIFLADESGKPLLNPQTQEPFANGTGFFVLVENENGPGFYGYLVTAKHVVRNENGEFYKRIFVRINKKDEEAAFLPIDLVTTGQNQNVFTSEDATVDIAVIPAWPEERTFDTLGVPTSMIKSKEDFKKTTIVEGSDVFFVGLFAPHYGDKKNTPIFRFGRVAMMTDEPIRWQEAGKPPELTPLYLLETMSFGGNSGAPVFFSQGIDREPGKIYAGTDIFLAGVMRGNFNEPRVGTFIQTPNSVAPLFAQNIGIAAVTPAYFLHDILFSETLKKFRKDNPIKAPEAEPKKPE